MASTAADLLLAVLADDERKLRDLDARPGDWGAVVPLAARHRVRPLLFQKLSNTAMAPCGVRSDLSTFTSLNTRRVLRLTVELNAILDLFGRNGIAAAPFKGPLLAAIGHGSAALREAGDLDILVQRADIVRARQLLIDQGFVPIFPTASGAEMRLLSSVTGPAEREYCLAHAEHHLLDPRAGVNVDLHWNIALRQFAPRLAPGEVWSWLAPQPFAGREVMSFGPAPLLVVLCVNGAKDCWRRFDRICDVAGLLRRCQPSDVVHAMDLGARVGAGRMVRVGLHLAGRLLKAPLPAEVLERLEADRALPGIGVRVARDLFRDFADSVEAGGWRKSLFHLRMCDGWVSRLAYLAGQLEPTVGDWAALPLPRLLRPLHYATRPMRLAWRALMGKRSD